jgi:tetratricopeptide (TPR) repeat protein
MPSLQQLEEFASSFKAIGDENINSPVYEDFPLPETEPPEPFPPALTSGGGADDSDGVIDVSLDDSLDNSAGQPVDGAEAAPGDGGGGLPDIDELFGGMAADLTGAPADLPIPAVDIETPEAPAAETAETPPEEDAAGDSSIDLGDFDLGGEEGAAAPAAEEGGPDGFDLGDLGGEEGAAAPAAEEGGPDGLDLGDLGGEEGAAAPAAEEGGLDGLDLDGFGLEDGEELIPPEESSMDASSLFDEFNEGSEDPGGETLAGESPEGGGPSGEDAAGGFEGITGIEGIETPAEAGDAFDTFSMEAGDFSTADFSIDSLDTNLDAAGAKAAAIPGAVPAEEEVEEIKLTEDDFRRLQETLSGYPLNLRIACEEIIAEQAVEPRFMSALIKLLVRGAPVKETAALAGKILGRSIPVPRGAATQTGADFEAEQASFRYIFIKKFLPLLRIFILAALALFVTGYLCWHFIINPVIANGIYKDGYERIWEGEYNRANDLFLKAFERHRMKDWFYRYAEAFRDMRQYQFAERKYDELLRVYPKDKKGALDYAFMETNHLKNYQKADQIIRTNILDYAVDDREGLVALGENNLAWGEENPERYEEARAVYARLIERYGRQDPFLEGMLKYFIRTDKLNEVLPLQAHFMGNPKKRKIAVPTLAELGGYLLDKKFEDVRGVPDEYADRIEGVQNILLRAIKEDPAYPEPYYHLARYYNHYESINEERAALESAIEVFDAAPEGTPKRAAYNVDTHRRYAEVLIGAGEFFPAAEQLARGVRLYEDARARGVLKSGPLFGRVYADLGDLAFFTQSGDMEAALRHYRTAEANGWSPAEVQYRMGVAHYELGQWEEALGRFFIISDTAPNNRRLLYALGNTSYLRGDYYAAQSYYNRLMDILEANRVRFPNLAPGSRPEGQDLAERIMVTENNLGVTLEALTRISGSQSYRSRALGLLAESIRAWDVLTRNPETMTRMRPIRDLYGPGVNLAYLNAQNILHPIPGYDQQIFMRIDRDMQEPSDWENLVPRDYRLSENLYMNAE